MAQPSRPTRRLAVLTGALLLAVGSLLATAPSALAEEPAEAAPTWRVYLELQAVDAAGNPSPEPPTAVSLTISADDGTTATCSPTSDSALACDYPETGFVLTRGASYVITAGEVPAGLVVGNVGTFTTGTSYPGPQCTPNHAGIADPCLHTVTIGPAVTEVSSRVVVRGPDGQPVIVASDPPLQGQAGSSASVGTVVTSDAAAGTEAATTTTTVPAGVLPGAASTDDGAVPAATRAPVAQLSPASAVSVPDASNPGVVVVLASVGLLLCGIAAFALVHTSRRERHTS